MSKKQLEEQRRYDILESDIAKTSKKVVNNGNWFLDYCKKYGAKVNASRRAGVENAD